MKKTIMSLKEYKTVKVITFAVLLFVDLSFAQETKVIYDTIVVKQTVIDTVYRGIPENPVTLKALEDSQKFYSDSFSSILTAVGISVAFLSMLFAGITFFNSKQTENAKEEFKKINNQFKELEGKIKIELGKLEKDQIKNNVFREISKIYLTAARSRKLANGNEEAFLDFFHNLNFFYYLLWKNEVELNEKDAKHFKIANQAIDKYIMSKYTKAEPFEISGNLHLIGFFLLSLQNIIDYCKKTDKKEQEEIVNKTWEKSCIIFGGEDKAKTAIEYYKDHKDEYNEHNV